jgi:predicted aconitase
MRLSNEEKKVLAGKQGEAPRLALEVIVELGELFGAEELMAVSQVHIDTTVYMVDSGVEFAEKCARLGGRFSVPTSLNASAIDHFRWQEYRVPLDLLEKCRRLENAYLAMGAGPTWTCAPYQQGMIPRFGQQIAWGESNAIAFANSIIGARTNRYGDLMDICAGIVGRVPRFGLHLEENRKAELLIRLEDFSSRALADDALYPLVGFLLGELAGDRVAALQGVPVDVKMDALKGLSAAAASSGAVGLFHVVGVTPEAQNLRMCLKGTKPKEELAITPRMVLAAEERLWTAKGRQVDMIAVGCPHFSFAEFIELGRLMAGKRIHDSVAFWVYTSRAVYGWLENCGLLKALKETGILVLTDACPLQYPKKTWKFSAAFSNSAKFVNYCYSQTGLPVGYGSLKDCVESGVSGKISRRRRPWP